MDTMLTGLDFAIIYLDDVLIKSENQRQHCEQIKKGFKRRKEYGFKLSSEKCEFFMSQIKFLEQIIDTNGRRLDYSWAEVIKSISTPKNVTTLQSFLGLINYYNV